jgi:hypothetical protein
MSVQMQGESNSFSVLDIHRKIHTHTEISDQMAGESNCLSCILNRRVFTCSVGSCSQELQPEYRHTVCGGKTLNYTLMLQLAMAWNKQLPSGATKNFTGIRLATTRKQKGLWCVSMDGNKL